MGGRGPETFQSRTVCSLLDVASVSLSFSDMPTFIHTSFSLSISLSLVHQQMVKMCQNRLKSSSSSPLTQILRLRANEWPTSGRTLSSKIHSKRLEKSLSRFVKGKIFCRVVMNSVLSFFCRPRLGLHKSQFLAGDNHICSPIAR